MVLSIAFDVVIAAAVLYRQRRIRPVPRVLHLRLPAVLGVIGIIQVLDFTQAHHVSAGAWWLVVGATVVGAGVLGFVRALTVRIWAAEHWVLRQGTWVTMALWVLSLALHLSSGIGAAQLDAGAFEASSFLLYLALTLGVQAAIVHQRAVPLWRALGPDAGPRIGVTFGAGPGGAGGFLATFGDVGDVGNVTNGGGAAAGAPRPDPTIIDAEVVEDEDPPRLR